MRATDIRNDSFQLIREVIQDLNGICEDCDGLQPEKALSDIEDRIKPVIKALTMVRDSVNSYLTRDDKETKSPVESKNGYDEGYKDGIIATLTVLPIIGLDIPEGEGLETFFDETSVNRVERVEIMKELGIDVDRKSGSGRGQE